MNLRLHSPFKLTIQVTNTCNLQCRACYGSCSLTPSAVELDTAAWFRFVDYLVENGFIQIFFEGGEPLVRPDFLKILEHCAGRLMIWVRTNGTLLQPEIAQAFKALKVGTVCVDVLGASEATHDYMTGTLGSFERACQGITTLVALGIPTVMTCLVTRLSIPQLNDYLALAKKMGVPRVGLLRLYPIGRAKHVWSELAPTLQETMAAIRGLRVLEGVRVMQSWHPNDPNCCWQNAAVDAFGNSIGCPYLREFVNYGNIREKSFLETWEHPLYRRLRSGEVTRSCSDCSKTQGSRGGCRATAYAFTKRWDAPDPFCSELNNGIDVSELPKWLSEA
jgi:radical SAM protein with 4Fe4S-binding SPASM domain